MAKRSATECAAILHVCERLKLGDQGRLHSGRDLLLRIVAMLVQMAKRIPLPGSGSGSGSGSGNDPLR